MKTVILAVIASLAMSGCDGYDDVITKCTTNYDGTSTTCRTRYRDGVEVELACRVYEDNSQTCTSPNTAGEIAMHFDSPDVTIYESDEEVIIEGEDTMTIVKLEVV